MPKNDPKPVTDVDRAAPGPDETTLTIPAIQTLRFRIMRSSERCCRCSGLVQTITGIDEDSQKQIEGWEYYCATCQHLVMSARQVEAASLRPTMDNKIGRVVAVPFPLAIERGA